MEQPQAQAASTESAASPPDAGSLPSQPDMSDASIEQLDELMTTGKVELPPKPAGSGVQEAPKGDQPPAEIPPAITETAKPGETPAATPPPETPPAEIPPETPPAATPPTDTPPAEPEGSERFRFRDPSDKAIVALRKVRPELSWAQAETIVLGEPSAPAPKADEIIASEPVVIQARETLSNLDAEIIALETQIDEHGKNEGLVTPEFSKAVKDLAAKREDRTEARSTLRSAEAQAAIQLKERETEATKHKESRLTSRKAAIELYPDVADETTELGKAVAAEFEALKDPNHPDNPLLYADSVPELITERVAKRLGIAPKIVAAPKAATPPVPPAKPPAAQPAQRQPVSPPSGKGTSVPPVVKPAEDAKKTVEHLLSDDVSLEELDEAFGAKDPSQVLAAAAGR